MQHDIAQLEQQLQPLCQQAGHIYDRCGDLYYICRVYGYYNTNKVSYHTDFSDYGR